MAHAGTPPRRRRLAHGPPFHYLLLSLIVFMVLQPYMLHGRMGSLLFAASEGALLMTGAWRPTLSPGGGAGSPSCWSPSRPSVERGIS